MTLTEIKERIIITAEKYRDEIIKIGELVKNNAELGYREEKTSELIRKTFDELGTEYEYPLAVTGVKAKLKGRKNLSNICIIGEMDSVICEGKPSHKCGHNAQIAALLGCAIVLSKSGVMNELDGDITIMAVPAEEFIDLEYRKSLKEDGKIKYLGGKQQLIYEGAFDNVDMAMMLHAQGNDKEENVYINGNNLGFIAKTITFKGKAVHGSTPFDGVNALNAAALAILGIHSNRETFREEDKIRIHPIITKGGDVVNSVPDEVCIDTYVRGSSYDAIKKGELAVDRAVNGAAQIVGATVEIENISGYLPLKESKELSEVFEVNAIGIVGKEKIKYGEEITGSSDIGDLSHLIPTIQPSIGGFDGALHSSEFEIADKISAYVNPTKMLCTTAADLLFNGAENAIEIREKSEPKMTKEEYLKYLNREEI